MKILLLLLLMSFSVTSFGFVLIFNIAKVNEGFSTDCDPTVENCLHLFALDASGASANTDLAGNGSVMNIVAIHLYTGPMSGNDLSLKVVSALKKIGANAKVMAFAQTNGGLGMRAAYVTQDTFKNGGTVTLNVESTTRVTEAISVYTTGVQGTKRDLSFADFYAAYTDAANDQETLLATFNAIEGCSGDYATLADALDSCGAVYSKGDFGFASWIKLLLP